MALALMRRHRRWLYIFLWLVIAALVGAVLTRKLAIEREERHLAARFGEAWAEYAARTPRWLWFS
jgi:protein-S-isoprenylcysteine O-methyltransferase Ste14